MREHRRFAPIPAIFLAALAWVVPAAIHAAPIPPIPDNPKQAQTSLGYGIKTRCPELHIADAGTKAVVVFWVPARGAHSRISVKTSSGLDDLDAAAIACVSKLKFAPATTLGDGESVDSWQQIALSWADPVKTYEAIHPATPSPGLPRVNAAHENSGGEDNGVTVHVCVDGRGKIVQKPAIVQSSGDPALDQAALNIAAAGSVYYRPRASASDATPGCVRLGIEFGTQ